MSARLPHISMHILVLLQLAATATGYHRPQLVSCHLHAARARRGHPVLEEKQGRSPLDEMGGAFKGGFEDAVKRVTGNKEYQFGDFTRSAVEGTKVGVEDAVKKVTGNEEYQCNSGSNLKLAAREVKPQPSPPHRSQALHTLVARSENARPLVLASSW